VSLQNRIAKLAGVQRKILDFVVDICLAREESETGPIETLLVAQYINSTYGSTKTSINRLIEKVFLTRQKGKTAKGGYINLGIPDEIKQIIVNLRERVKQGDTVLNLISTIRAQLDNNVSPYSSSNNITTIKKEKGLPNLWEIINITPLKDLGFAKNHLKQLVDKNTVDIVQESIYHFAYGLSHNKKKFDNYSDPLNVFMGVLRKGEGWFEANYQSPQEIAQKKLLEQKKAARGRREKIAKEMYQLAFSEWEASLPKEELETLVPEKPKRGSSARLIPYGIRLQAYFSENIWPDKKADYLVD